MRNITITILLVFSICKLYPQSNSCDNLLKLESYFVDLKFNEEAISPENTIPLDLSQKLLGTTIINENVVSVNAIYLFNNKKSKSFIIELMYPEGGYTSIFYLVCFSHDCKLMQKQIIGNNVLEDEGGTQSIMNLLNDSILEIRNEKVMYNAGGEETVLNKNYSYYFVNQQCFYSIEKNESVNGRLYPESSIRVIDLCELKKMDIESLVIMRNEIFADHGYIFKTEKWNKYFTNQDWCTPRFEDVANKLTIIEKINIENILKVAPLK